MQKYECETLVGALNLKLYKSAVLMKGMSAIAGMQLEFKPMDYTELPVTPLIRAWLEDDDMQEITVCSTNFGIVRTFQKQFRV